MSLTDTEQIHQIVSVLRLVHGDEIVIVHEGKEAPARIENIEEGKITLSVGEILLSPTPPREVYLACSVLKKDNVELIVQKATEIGVAGIIPFISERTVKTTIAMKRLEKISREAVEQSGWGSVPQLYDIQTYHDAVDMLKGMCETLYLADTETDVISPIQGSSCGVLVGPEGGFSEEERAYAYQKEAHPLSLGKSTLRGETAAVLSVYHILYWR